MLGRIGRYVVFVFPVLTATTLVMSIKAAIVQGVGALSVAVPICVFWAIITTLWCWAIVSDRT